MFVLLKSWLRAVGDSTQTANDKTELNPILVHKRYEIKPV